MLNSGENKLNPSIMNSLLSALDLEGNGLWLQGPIALTSSQ